MALNYWRSLLTRIGSRNRSFSTAAAPPGSHTTRWAGAERTPIFVMGGMVVWAMLMATYTATQQLVHSPAVYVSRRRRGTVPEVEEPERVRNFSDRFLKMSILRHAARIQ
ncbi:hypothetical protein CRG98_036803 [Punica granatum]|uniref:Uncharacterized protein n=1 Tax=Punica granatum TaxID=22663 RepID=A0A2I0IFP4_PUNGR|nr:hypothetical protein CRG98_036803 [Punica granatum]